MSGVAVPLKPAVSIIERVEVLAQEFERRGVEPYIVRILRQAIAEAREGVRTPAELNDVLHRYRHKLTPAEEGSEKN